MPRISVYIDGGPFQDALRGQGLSCDIDLRALLAETATQTPDCHIRFYAPEIPAAPYPVKHHNQYRWFDQLEAQEIHVQRCRVEVNGGRFVERGVETALATDLLADAAADRFDTAVVVSRRPDLGTAIKAVRAGGRVVNAAYFVYRLTPDNPLAPVCDQFLEISVAQAARHVRSGPLPPFL